MICRGCQPREVARNVDVKELINEQLTLEAACLPETEVRKRTEICQKCPYRSLHTCTKCGCYYEFRAHLPQKDCPQARWPKRELKGSVTPCV